MNNILTKMLVSVFTLVSLLMLIGSINQYLEVGSLENFYWVSRVAIFICLIMLAASSCATFVVFNKPRNQQG